MTSKGNISVSISIYNEWAKNKEKYKKFSFHENMFCYRGHRDDGPPVGVEHGVESCLFLLLLKHEDEGGEHDGPHPEQ